MKTTLYLYISFFVLINFLFCVSSRSLFAQSVAIQHKRILFINSNDERAAIVRPRTYTSPAKDKIPEENPVKTVAPKASLNFGFERQVFDLINKQRVENGLSLLLWNDDVAKVARVHSEEMANSNLFDHKGRDGSMVNNRADALGLNKWRSIGENIAYNRGFANPLEFAVEGWMKSPAHRQNILNNRWQESGIGIAITADGVYYFTQVFLLRK